MAVVDLIVVGILLVVGFVLAVIAISCWPRLHVGKPRAIMEWMAYSTAEIVTTKGGGTKEPAGRGRLIQQLEIKWWLGFSSRSRASWFFGFVRTMPR